MKAIFEKFDGTRTIQNPSNVAENSKIVLVPRNDNVTWQVIDFMRFDLTEEVVNGLKVFKQSEEELSFNTVPVNIMKRDSQPSDFIRHAP